MTAHRTTAWSYRAPGGDGEKRSPRYETFAPEEAIQRVRSLHDVNFRLARGGHFPLEHRHANYGSWTSDAVQFVAGGFDSSPWGV